jgi:hypothetical protein
MIGHEIAALSSAALAHETGFSGQGQGPRRQDLSKRSVAGLSVISTSP